MTFPGQRVTTDRYQVIPRSLVFLLQGEHILLVQIPPDRGAWAGLYNGIGGHIESGESPHAAAMREVEEETGISPGNLRLCGVVMVDTGASPGIALYVFVGQGLAAQLAASSEGVPEWIAIADLEKTPLVSDLPILIPKALACYQAGDTFSGLTTFDSNGHPSVHIYP